MFFILIIVGLVAGILAGMGMGGGTLLVPILTIFLDFEQKTAQLINLVAFLPTALFATIFYFKNKMIVVKKVLPIIIFALPSTLLFAYVASDMDDEVLRTLYGIFLLIIGGILFYNAVKKEKPASKN